MTYKDTLTNVMSKLSVRDRVKFVGYNTKCGHKMYGTLDNCKGSCIEMPVAENLMMGVAMGLSLEGFRPIVCLERSNFLLPMADAIINHLDRLPKLSGGQFSFPVIIRVVIGSDKPLDPGIQHTGDYTNVIIDHTDIALYKLRHCDDIAIAYTLAMESNCPSLIVEYKELYSSGGR